MRLTLLLAFSLVGCFNDETDVTPPKVVEPTAGQVFDRVLARVRMTPPDNVIGNNHIIVTTPGTQGAGHAEWRTNGMYSVEPQATSNTDVDNGFVFSVTLVPGANHLELARCTVAGKCGWTPVDVRVALVPGSPDPSFAGTGILAYPPTPKFDGFLATHGVWPLADGRVLVAGERMHVGSYPDQDLLAFKSDGSLDASFGMYGVAAMPAAIKGMRLFPLSTGGYAAFLGGNYLTRLSATGQVDATYGTNGLATITAASATGGLAIQTVDSDGAGGFWVAGVTPLPPGATKNFLLHLDASGNELTYQEVGTGTALAARVSAAGVGAFVTPDHIELSTGASIALPQVLGFGSRATIVFAQNGDVLVGVPAIGGGGPRLYRIAGTAIAATIDLPFSTTEFDAPLIAEASDGSVYVAGAWAAPADTACCRWFPSSEPSIELGLVRIRGASLDAAFGTAHAGSALSWLPMTTERVVDTATALAIGPDGAPWILGTGATTDTDGGSYTVRGPGIVLAKILK